MMYVLFFVSLILTAWGNAMRKRVYRRKAMITDGKDVPEMGLFYDRGSVVVVTLGAIGMVSWFVLVVFGNPIALFATA